MTSSASARRTEHLPRAYAEVAARDPSSNRSVTADGDPSALPSSGRCFSDRGHSRWRSDGRGTEASLFGAPYQSDKGTEYSLGGSWQRTTLF